MKGKGFKIARGMIAGIICWAPITNLMAAVQTKSTNPSSHVHTMSGDNGSSKVAAKLQISYNDSGQYKNQVMNPTYDLNNTGSSSFTVVKVRFIDKSSSDAIKTWMVNASVAPGKHGTWSQSGRFPTIIQNLVYMEIVIECGGTSFVLRWDNTVGGSASTTCARGE